ncbi:MAG: hypothetical protein ACHP65_07700 [Legionellales bacterium]
MDKINLGCGLPMQTKNTIKPNGSYEQSLTHASATERADSCEQMTVLLDIVKAAPSDGHALESVQYIKSQVHSGQYSINMPALIAHLFQELSIEGAD